MSYYNEQSWDQAPTELPYGARGWAMDDLDHQQPGLLGVEGWHFRRWRPTLGVGDPYYLYAPDGSLVGRWETEPSYSEMYDVYRAWSARHEH